MSRIVRSSKFRHVFGMGSKLDQCYTNIKISKSPHESNMCAVNSKFVAVVLEGQGGGSFMVIPHDKFGRLDINYPKVSGHKDPVLDVAWNPFDENIIASCSQDCTVKVWRIPDGGLEDNLDKCLLDLLGHMRKCAHVQWHPTAENILASSATDNIIFIWNLDDDGPKIKPTIKIDCHPDNILSFDWNKDGSLLATTCKDKKIRVIDPRKNEIITEGQGHVGSKASRVIFCGDTGKLFTTGFSRLSDRQYAVWDAKDVKSALTFENIDNGNGVLFPFWDEGTKMVYVTGKGDTQIKYFEIVDNSPYAYFLSMYQSTQPQRSVAMLPKRHVNYMECEVMRFYKLCSKGYIEPVTMKVPRKSDLFQDDIFPPAYGGVPSMGPEEWLGGMNKDPVTVKFTPDGLVMGKAPQAKKEVPSKKKPSSQPDPEPMTATQAKVHSFEKRSSSTELSSSSRDQHSNSASVSPPPVTPTATVVTRPEPTTSAEYRKGYYEVVAENDDLRVQVEDLKKKLAAVERRASYKRH